MLDILYIIQTVCVRACVYACVNHSDMQYIDNIIYHDIFLCRDYDIYRDIIMTFFSQISLELMLMAAQQNY